MVFHREARHQPKQSNKAWSVDFVRDELSNGRKFGALTVVGIFTREGLGIDIDYRMRGEDFVVVLNVLVHRTCGQLRNLRNSAHA